MFSKTRTRLRNLKGTLQAPTTAELTGILCGTVVGQGIASLSIGIFLAVGGQVLGAVAALSYAALQAWLMMKMSRSDLVKIG